VPSRILLPPMRGQIGWRGLVRRQAFPPVFPPQPTNYDWPNPRGPGFNPEFRTWIEEGNNLPPFGGIGPPQPIDYDWPNPQRGAVRCIDLLTWTQAGNAPVANVITRSPLYTAIIPPRFNPELRTFAGPGNNLSPPAAAAPPPGPNLDWPNPRGPVPAISLKTWLNATALQLIGQDQFFGAPGLAPAYDFPNPRGATAGIVLRTWSDAVRLPLIAQPAPNLDWPNPIARFPRDLSWVAQFNIQLHAIAAAPFANYDWPNPRAPVPASDLRTWTGSGRLDLIGLDQFFAGPGQPPACLDWPNPRGAVAAIELRTFAAGIAEVNLPAIIYPATFGLFDWPNPRGAVPGIALRTFIDPVRTWLIGRDQFFGAPGQAPADLDWPNPRGAIPAIGLRTWSPVFLPLLSFVPPVPFVLTDWPNPRGAVAAIALRTWTDPLRPLLLGRDQFFGAPGQPPAILDWPNPRGPVGAIDLRTFLQGCNPVRPSLIVPVPFFNYDWPNPRGPVHLIDLRSWWMPLASGVLVPFGGFYRAASGQRDRIDGAGSLDRSGSAGSLDRGGMTGQRDRAGITGTMPRTDEPGEVD